MFTNEMIFEHRFWLQIMGDHARFILYSLAPNEAEAIKKAKQFIENYDDLLERVNEHVLIHSFIFIVIYYTIKEINVSQELNTKNRKGYLI